MKVLVCGSKDWSDEKVIEGEFRKLPSGTIIIHGASGKGADMIADKLAMKYGFGIRRYQMDDQDPKSTESIRNSRMIKTEHVSGDPIHLGLVFTRDLSRSRGAKDVVERAKKAGIKMVVIG